MTVRTHPSDSTQDDSCPKSGDSSVEAGLCLASLKDAKASHITGGDDWFPTSQWPSSGSNSSNSTGRHCSDRRLAMHERAVDLEPPVTSSENCEFSEKLLRARDYWNTHGNAVRETGIEPVHGIPNNAGGTSEPFSLKGTGSPRDSTFSPSLGIVGDTAEDSQLPLQGVNSATNRNHAKTSLVCGPLSVQQTLTERQLDIEKRMLEVRQQNRRRLYRRQQEAKEQQLQRMREHRAALLARREKIKLASLWKERGMAAAARTAAICKERGKLERLPSEPSQPTENDNRSADELLAALVISESISLQTELGSREGDICADTVQRATSSFPDRSRLPDASVSTGLAATDPMVSVSSTAPPHKLPLSKRSIISVRQRISEPKTANRGASTSHQSTEQTNCTLSDTLLSCRPENRLTTSQRVCSLGLQFQGMPLVSHSSTQAPYPTESAFSLALRHRAKPRIKQANSKKAHASFLQNGERRMQELLNDEECKHTTKQLHCKVGPVVVRADQHLKKQLNVQLQQRGKHVPTKKLDKFCVTDIPEGVASQSVISSRKSASSASSCRPRSTNSMLAQDHDATEMARPAHLTVNKLTEVADACQKKECSAPLIAPEEIDPRQTRDRYTLEETETKNGVPLFALKEGLASCSFQNAAVTKPETASSPVPSKWEGSATAQAAGLQLVRICRDVCHEQELPHHVLVNTASNESQKAPCKTHQAHERDLCCMRNLKLPLGKKDRYTMHFPSPYGESDCSSAATKPQEDEISRSGGRTAAKHIEDGAKLHTSTKAVNAELIEDEDPTISAVWALQQAEVEEEKRLLLLEMSQHVIERQAETRRRERNLQSELMAQHSQNEQHNRHEGFDCCSPSLEKRKPGVEAYVVAMNAVNEPLVRKIEHSSGQKPSDSGSCRKVPSHFHVSLPLAKGGSLQNARATQPIQERKHFRWGPASLALNASRTAPKPMQNALAPSRNSLDVATLAEGTTSEEKKVLDNGQHQQLHGDFPVKQQQALIGQLLGHGLLAGQTRAGLLEITKAAVCSPDKSFCYHRDKYNACLQARALQRRAVLQALQQLLLFPSKTSHRNTLKKGYRHEKEERVPTQEGQKGVISQRNYQRQISTGQPRHSASSAVENTVPEGNHSKGPLFCRSSSISRGAARLSSPLSTPGRVEQ